MKTLKYATAIIAFLIMGNVLKAQNPWQVDIPAQQIFINPLAADPKVGIGTDNPSERLEVIGTSLLRGSVGVNTSLPSTQLSVRGQMSMSTIGFSTSRQDKISLYGNRLGQDNMVGLGFETETIISGGGGIATERVLFSKAENRHRWYIGANADGGVSSAMTLSKSGFGLNVDNPGTDFHMVGDEDLTQMLIAPAETVNGADVAILLAEDDNYTYGMSITYDGGDNKMYIGGKSNTAFYGPHLSIERNSGDVAIGYGSNNVPSGYKLAVDGGIICEEVNVQLSSSWPDYVFEDSYELMGIRELAANIEDNGHLPGIPSAAVVASEGIDLADMQTRMMEKIEELTLYIITLQDQIDNLNDATNSAK